MPYVFGDLGLYRTRLRLRDRIRLWVRPSVVSFDAMSRLYLIMKELDGVWYVIREGVR